MGRIIYAEDDEIVAEIVTQSLMDAGHAVGWVQDGEEALRAMKFRPPDLAILDQRMPKKIGREVLREMRQQRELTMTPVLMLTAVSGKADQDIAYFEGADDYLTKPFEPEELVCRAEALMKQRLRRTLAQPLYGKPERS